MISLECAIISDMWAQFNFRAPWSSVLFNLSSRTRTNSRVMIVMQWPSCVLANCDDWFVHLGYRYRWHPQPYYPSRTDHERVCYQREGCANGSHRTLARAQFSNCSAEVTWPFSSNRALQESASLLGNLSHMLNLELLWQEDENPSY